MHETAQCPAETPCCLVSSSRSNFRSRAGHLSNIVVIEVNRENWKTTWPCLLLAIRNASFISLDLELSGLGVQKGWLAKSLEERYDVIRQSAQTRSVLSVGIATFQLVNRKETNAKKKLKYKCQVFNILTLCAVPFTVEADGFLFLSKHKFDFNRWVSLGIPYDSDTRKPKNIPKPCFLLDSDYESFQGNTMTKLWSEVLCAAVPIALHNGLIDLTFIYQHFYGVLPETVNEFIVSVSDWFLLPDGTPGLYDSKYIAEYITRFKASFLEYVFRKCQRENAVEQARNRLYVSVEFNFALAETELKNAIDIVDCELPSGFDASALATSCPITEKRKDSLCRQYSNYGFCRLKDCSYVHDVDILLSVEEQKQARIRKRRKRRYDYESKLSESRSVGGQNDKVLVLTSSKERTAVKETSVGQAQANNLLQTVTGCHRAGVDSFMTGFAVLFMQRMNLLRTGSFDPKSGVEHSKQSCTSGNRLALPGMMVPLVLHKSGYIKPADDHAAKWIEIERERNRRVQQRIQ